MRIEPLPIAGAFVITPVFRGDERGQFARVFCAETFRAAGLHPMVSQGNVSLTTKAGTVRGLHRQAPPHSECKLVRCTRGRIFDVVADVTEDSPTFGTWAAVELDAQSHQMLYVPETCAHGFQTLTDDTEVTYLVSAPYAPEAELGVRYDDPTLSIAWPLPVTVVSVKDAALPLLKP